MKDGAITQHEIHMPGRHDDIPDEAGEHQQTTQRLEAKDSD